MSILFSRQCEYALQAVLYLTLKQEHISIKELTAQLKIPYHFVAKILQVLRKKGILVSRKGFTGGFTLAMPAQEITLLHIVEAIDGTTFMQGCVLGFVECSHTQPCSLHTSWSAIRDQIHHELASNNIMEMANKMRKPSYEHQESKSDVLV